MNSHGVSEEKIDYMISNKEEITPRYLAYWFRTSNLIRSFKDVGMNEKRLNEVLGNIACLNTYESNDRRKKADEIINKYDTTDSTDESILNFDAEDSSTTKKIVNDDASGVHDSSRPSSQKSHLVVAHLPKMLHITTDYIGTTENLLQSDDYEELRRDLLSSCTMQIVALFSDERGTGALVKHFVEENDSLFAEERNTPHEDSRINDGHGTGSSSIPRYRKFTKTAKLNQERIGLKQTQTAPHITLITNPGKSASEIGEAAYEFQELLTLRNDLIVEEEVLATSKFSNREEEPTCHSESDTQFKVISIGKFRAVLFKQTVLFTGTYAYSYSATTAKPVSRSRARSK